MKLVMTLLARNEADIVDAQLAFHLNAGVDFVIATDNASDDGTTEILERYERAGRVHLIHEQTDDIRQGAWVTRMARLAATDFDADWVINSDADEFWWPRGGTLKDVLAAVPERYGVVRGAWRHFLPRPELDRAFYEAMTTRLRRPASPGDKATIYHAHQKVAHRARSDVRVGAGNHDVDATGGFPPLRSWYPIEILHFSFRSRLQFVTKASRAYEAWSRSPGGGPTLHHKLAYDAVQPDATDDLYGRFLVDDDALEQGLADGTLAIDTRLRDALRGLRVEEGGFALPEPGAAGLSFPKIGIADEAEYLDELAPLVAIEGIVRAEARVDAMQKRLEALERRGRLPRAFAVRAERLTHRRRLAPR
jgi:hypothetical protein